MKSFLSKIKIDLNPQEFKKLLRTISIILFIFFTLFAGWRLININNDIKNNNQEIKKYNSRDKNLKKEIKELNFNLENNVGEEKVKQNINNAKETVEKVINLQNIISKQSIAGAEGERTNDETKKAQKQLEEVTDIKSGSAQLLNWYSQKNNESLHYSITTTNNIQGVDILFTVKDKNGKDIRYLTGEFNPQNKKIEQIIVFTI